MKTQKKTKQRRVDAPGRVRDTWITLRRGWSDWFRKRRSPSVVSTIEQKHNTTWRELANQFLTMLALMVVFVPFSTGLTLGMPQLVQHGHPGDLACALAIWFVSTELALAPLTRIPLALWRAVRGGPLEFVIAALAPRRLLLIEV